MADKNQKRFVKVYGDTGFAVDTAIFVDRETGVNYLWHCEGSAGGLTPLLDKDGKPVITPQSDFDDK